MIWCQVLSLALFDSVPCAACTLRPHLSLPLVFHKERKSSFQPRLRGRLEEWSGSGHPGLGQALPWLEHVAGAQNHSILEHFIEVHISTALNDPKMSLMMKESQESVVGRKIPVCAPPPPTLLQAPFRSRFSPLALAHPAFYFPKLKAVSCVDESVLFSFAFNRLQTFSYEAYFCIFSLHTYVKLG